MRTSYRRGLAALAALALVLGSALVASPAQAAAEINIVTPTSAVIEPSSTVHVTGVVAGTAPYTYQLDSDPTPQPLEVPDGVGFAFDLTGLGSGSHTLSVTDSLANTTAVTFFVDSGDPVFTVTAPADTAGFQAGDSFNFAASVTDFTPVDWTLKLDANPAILGSGTDGSPGGDPISVIGIDTTGWSQGYHYLVLSGTDDAGHFASISHAITIGAPQITITTANGTIATGGSFVLEATITDNDLWFWTSTATMTSPGTASFTAGVGPKLGSGDYPNPANVVHTVYTGAWPNGTYNVGLSATDHSSYSSANVQIVVANTSSIDTPTENQHIADDGDGDINVTGTLVAVDGSAYYQLDSESPVEWTTAAPGDLTPKQFNFAFDALSDGPHSITVYSGAESVTRNFFVDNTPPEILVNDSYFGPQGTTSISVDAWINDDSLVWYDLRNIYEPNYQDIIVHDHVTYSGSIHEDFGTSGWVPDDAPGRYFAIYAVDAAGNPAFLKVPMGIDTQTPTVTFAKPDAHDLISGSTVLRGKATDATSGVQWVNVFVHPLKVDGTCKTNTVIGGSPLAAAVVDGTWSLQLGASAPADGTYCLRAVAGDYVGYQDTARVLPVTIDTSAPATPTPITPDGWVANADTFEWTESTDDSGVTYEFAVDVNLDFSTEFRLQEYAENSLELWSFSAGTYWWRVRAIDGAGNKSPWSDKVKFNVIGKPFVCSCTDAFSDLLSFHWSEVEGPGGIDHYDYRIHYEGDPTDGGDDQVLNGEVDGSIYWVDQAFDDTMAQGEWTIRVRAVYNHRLDPGDPGSKVGPWSRAVTVIHDSVAPGAPTLLSPDDELFTNNTDFWFTWQPQDGDDRYRFRMSETSPATDVNGRLIDGTTNGLNNPGHEAGVIPEGEYWWQVRAIDEAGNRGAWSEVRHLVVDHTAPAAVNLVSLTNGTTVKNSKVSFDWDAVTDNVNYVIELSKSPATNGTGSLQTLAYLGTGLGSSKLDNLKLANGTYYWHVRAVDAAGNLGPWSQTWTVKVAVPSAANTAFTGTETVAPSDEPTDEPSDEPTDEPTDEPSDEPTDEPTAAPSDAPEAGGEGDSGFPVWIIIGIVILVLVGGGFLIRFLLRRA